MKTLTSIVLAATILTGGAAVAAPALAAPSAGTGALSCSSGNDQMLLSQAKDQLAQQLRLDTKQAATIDEWNGCFKVQYTNNSGHTVVSLYDPDTLTLVNRLS